MSGIIQTFGLSRECARKVIKVGDFGERTQKD